LLVGFVAVVEVLWFGEKSLKGGWGRRKRGCQTHVCEDVAAAPTSRWPYPRPTSTSPRKSPEVLSVCLSVKGFSNYCRFDCSSLQKKEERFDKMLVMGARG
jgi:hypothetical protein